MIRNLLLLTLVSLMGSSCRKDPVMVNISHAPVSIVPEDYSKLRKRWTRKEKIIYKFDTTLDVHATLLSWEFRWAYVIKYGQLFKLDSSERKNLWAREEEELKETVQFVVGVACTDNTWNDLDKGQPQMLGPGKRTKGSIWRISLKIDST
ncbi:hypothetical protein KJ865_13735, partial [Myxococcota bacterium]|nr:hypothetical protein [Myxococcota bacterium]